MCEWLSGCSEAAMVLLSLCIMLFMGFLVTRATRLLRLPNVSGYIIAGILLGPYVLHAVPDTFLSSIGFVKMCIRDRSAARTTSPPGCPGCC